MMYTPFKSFVNQYLYAYMLFLKTNSDGFILTVNNYSAFGNIKLIMDKRLYKINYETTNGLSSSSLITFYYLNGIESLRIPLGLITKVCIKLKDGSTIIKKANSINMDSPGFRNISLIEIYMGDFLEKKRLQIEPLCIEDNNKIKNEKEKYD